MKTFRAIVFLLSAFICFSLKTDAYPAKIVAGEMLLGGTAYGTADYQTFIDFSLTAHKPSPRIEYRMRGFQEYSVYLDHPVQPNGAYDYRVRMPYGPQSLLINGRAIFPVWFEDCVWNIRSSAQTPSVTPNSPQFITTVAPFLITGSSLFFGGDNSNFRIKGTGNAEIKFEKIGNKYYFREARYVFGANASQDKTSK